MTLLRRSSLLVVLLTVLAAVSSAQPKRVLYVTHSAGFRHDSIPFSQRILESIAAASGKLSVTSTEDLSFITASRLREFDAVFFFTSGELALSPQQKEDLLAFVRDGKGFGGVHSATDTLYSWPEYGDLIGGYFDDHPWAHDVTIDVEDPDHPATRHLGSSFRIPDEIYQFREFSRDRVRVLLTLDVRSVDLNLPNVKRRDRDFALAWVRNYGRGRSFYTALGHGENVWGDPRFQNMLLGALLWLTGQEPGEAAPRRNQPRIDAGGVVNAAPRAETAAAPNGYLTIWGSELTSGSRFGATSFPLPHRLAGTRVEVDGRTVPVHFAAPNQVNVLLPHDLPAEGTVMLKVTSATSESAPVPVALRAAAPGIFGIAPSTVRAGGVISVYANALGPVRRNLEPGEAVPLGTLIETSQRPVVTMGGERAEVLFSGLAPLFPSLYQLEVRVPAGLAGSVPVIVEVDGRRSNAVAVTVTP